jgi:hypothetical protein
MKVGEALTAWRERHGRTESDGRRLFWVSFGPLRIPVPHPGQLHWHDLHHIALAYEPDLVGEIEVSAFELRTGTANVVVLVLCLAAVSLGVFIAPRRTFRAFRRARGTRNLYACPVSNADVLEWHVDELRAWISGAALDHEAT